MLEPHFAVSVDAAEGARLILLVEEDVDGRAMYAQYLAFHGFRVIEAGDGQDGLRHAHRADLIVLDLGLPRLDGWALARRLKGDARTQHIPVLVVTGFGPDYSRRRAEDISSKFDAVFLKPLSLPTLLAKIREMLGISN